MQKHRLKNLLLLILRSLLILCLLLALANPTLKAFNSNTSKPDFSVSLVHNGIYGGILDRDGNNLIQHQTERISEFDSIHGTQTKLEMLIEDPENSPKNIQRFGNYTQALNRCIKQIPPNAAAIHLQIPVFSWEEMAEAEVILNQSLHDYPGLTLSFLDYQKLGENLRAFTDLKSITGDNAPMLKLRINMHPHAYAVSKDRQNKTSVEINHILFSEMTADETWMDISVPYGIETKTLGKFSTPLNEFAAPDFFFSFPKAEHGILIHIGSTLTSLPSLGRESYFKKIIHLPDYKNIPWGKKISVIFISNEKAIFPENYSRLVEYVKQGGKLIITTGEGTDVPLVNRFLLQPFRMGRLRNLLTTAAPEPIVIHNSPSGWAQSMEKDLGKTGGSKKFFEFLPDSGNQILISQKMTTSSEKPASTISSPILITQDFYAGKILLWTTDMDNLNWTEIGVGTVVPLFHRAFQNSDLENRILNLSVASDSIFKYSLFHISNTEDVQILDPEGNLFTNFRIERSQIFVGPFARLGLYQILQSKPSSPTQKDTTFFAVNLANTDAANTDAKVNFLETLSEHKLRVNVVSPANILGMNNSTQALWKWLILAAILLLFTESIIALFFLANRERS